MSKTPKEAEPEFRSIRELRLTPEEASAFLHAVKQHQEALVLLSALDTEAFLRVFLEEFNRRFLAVASKVPTGLYEAATEAVRVCIGYSQPSPKTERLANVGRGVLKSKTQDNSPHYRFLQGWVETIWEEVEAKRTTLDDLLDSVLLREGGWQLMVTDEQHLTVLKRLANTLAAYFGRTAPHDLIRKALHRASKNGAVAALAVAYGVDDKFNFTAVRHALAIVNK